MVNWKMQSKLIIVTKPNFCMQLNVFLSGKVLNNFLIKITFSNVMFEMDMMFFYI